MTTENNELTINDLIPKTTNLAEGSDRHQGMVEIDPSSLKPDTPKEDPSQTNLAALFDNMSKAVDARIERDDKFIKESLEKLQEEELDKRVEEEDDSDETKNDSFNLSLDIDNDDDNFDDLKPEKDNSDEDDEKIEELKITLKDKIKPVTDAVDLKSFTVSKKHVTVTRTLGAINTTKHVADWVLYAAKKPISISEFTGYEIEQLNPGSSSRTRYNTYKDIYALIYSHIVDDNKPPFEVWVKSISFYDIPHIYFTIYRACFEGTNSIPYACTNKECGNMFMHDCKDIMEMVKYKNDDIKKTVNDILLTETTDSLNSEEYETEVVQISNNYALSFREPSVWNIIFENAILDDKFTEKYNQFLGIMVYIDEIYFINRKSNELEPIQVDVDPRNVLKTVKSRIVKYSEVLKSLTSDQFQFIQACIKKVSDRHDGMSYILPECTCPKCGTLIKEQAMEPDSLLFTRHQLAAIANI